MKNTRRFGKVRTQEEYLIYCRLEKAIKRDKYKKHGRKYSRDVSKIKLNGSRW